MDISQVISLAISLIPTIKTAAQAIESPGNGAQKTQVIVDAAIAGLKLLPQDTQDKIHADDIGGVAQAVTKTVVGFLNESGQFKKDEPAATPAPPVPVLREKEKRSLDPLKERERLTNRYQLLQANVLRIAAAPDYPEKDNDLALEKSKLDRCARNLRELGFPITAN